MKYRRLTIEELKELEKEFVRFLAVRSIPSETWQKMKAEESEKVAELIENFSDIVFETTLKKVNYLEVKRPKELHTFYCGPEKISMFGLTVNGETNLDFTKITSAEQMIGQIKLSNAQLKLFKGEKDYSKEREVELFEMMENGALISKDGYLYNLLKGMAPSSSE